MEINDLNPAYTANTQQKTRISGKASELLELPQEILIRSLKHLVEPIDVVNVSRTCRLLHELTKNSDVLRAVLQPPRSTSQYALKEVFDRERISRNMRDKTFTKPKDLNVNSPSNGRSIDENCQPYAVLRPKGTRVSFAKHDRFPRGNQRALLALQIGDEDGDYYQMNDKEPEPKGLLSADDMWILKEKYRYLDVYGKNLKTLQPRAGGAALLDIPIYNLTHRIVLTSKEHAPAGHYCFAQTVDETFVMHMRNEFLSCFQLPKPQEQVKSAPDIIRIDELDGFEEAGLCLAMYPSKATAGVLVLTSFCLLHLEFNTQSRKFVRTVLKDFQQSKINVGYFFDEGRGLMTNRQGKPDDIKSWNISLQTGLVPGPMQLVGPDLSLEWVDATGTRLIYSSESNTLPAKTASSHVRTLYYIAKGEQPSVQTFTTLYSEIRNLQFLENNSPYFLVKGRLYPDTSTSIYGHRTVSLGTIYPPNKPLVELPGLSSAWVFPSELERGTVVFVKQRQSLGLLDLRHRKTPTSAKHECPG